MRKKEVATGFAWNSIFSLINKVVIPIVVGIAVARIVGPVNVGLFGAAASILVIADLFREFGLTANFIVDQDHDERRNSQYMTLSVCIATLIGILLILVRGSLAAIVNQPVLEWAFLISGISMIVMGFATIPYAHLSRDGKFKELGLLDTVANLIGTVVMFVLVLNGFEWKALVLQVLVRNSASVLLCAYTCWIPLKLPDGTFIRGVAKKCLQMIGHNLLWTPYTIGDTYIATRFFGPEMSGNYAQAYNIGMKPLDLVSMPLARTLFVAFSKNQANIEELRDKFRRSLKVTLLLVIPIFGLLALFATETMTLLFGNKFSTGGDYLQWLCLYLAMRSVGSMSGNLLVSMHKINLASVGWILAYVYVGVCYFTGELTGSSMQFVMHVSIGATIAYSSNLILAMRQVKFRLEDLQFCLTGVVVSLPAISVAAGSSVFISSGSILFIAILLLSSLIQLLTIGLHFGVGAGGAFSKSGIKAIWSKV